MAMTINTTSPTDLLVFPVTRWSQDDRDRLSALWRSIADARVKPVKSLKKLKRKRAPCGWSRDTLIDLLDRLEADHHGRSRGEAIRHALDNDGWVSRHTVYEIGGYPSSRSIKGHLRPVERIVATMKAAGVIPDSAVSPIETIYDKAASGYSRALGFRVPMAVVNIWLTN